MTGIHLTTPFGRRPASLGHIAAQITAQRLTEAASEPGSNHPAAVDKWRLFRTLAGIRARLGVSDRALSVLNALLSFHQETALTLPPAGEAATPDCGLVVFPSNRALTLRAHGMSEPTLRRHLAQLVAAGLIVRRDSPNGKRYARRAGGESGGDVRADAFGFDLTPLVARAPEFEAVAEAENRARKARQLLKERVSLHRRDLGKLIALGLDEGLPGDWDSLRRRYMALLTPLRRMRDDAELAAAEAGLAALRRDVSKTLESGMNVEIPIGDDVQTDRHQSISKHSIIHDFEPASKEEGGESEPCRGEAPDDDALPPLGLVLEACPDIREHGPGGAIRGWSPFLEAARAVRPMIGISPDAWRDAAETMGEHRAAIAVAAILQRGEFSSEAAAAPAPNPGETIITVNGSPAIRSPGGYLRALTEKARGGELALGPVLMALIGQRLRGRRGRDLE